MTSMDSAQNAQGSRRQEEIERQIKHLKAWNRIVQVALPVAAVGAGIGAVTSIAAVFPIVAAVAAAAVAVTEGVVRRKRKELDTDIKELQEKGDIDPDKFAELSSEANRLTVNGPSS